MSEAPAEMSNEQTSKCAPAAAIMRALRSASSRSVTRARLCSSSHLHTFTWPPRAASMSAVAPSLLRALRSAPAPSSHLSVSTCPFAAASSTAVQPALRVEVVRKGNKE